MNALENIRVADFTRLLPGPMATHLLSQMGAEVVKIESPRRQDYARFNPPQVDGTGVFYQMLNHSKEMVQVDYNGEEGRKKMLTYLSEVDVLMEQFRPGAMEAWGLGYEDVKKVNDQIIYVSITGYGQNGELSKEAGHDLNYLAYSGLLSLLKDSSGKPVVPGFQLADIGGGSFSAVMAIQAALIRRLRTGQGARIDVSMTDGVMPFITIPYSMQQVGMDHRSFNVINGQTAVNYAVYKCADNKWLSVAALELKFWNRICELVEREDWKRTNISELFNSVFPRDEVVALFLKHSRDEWMNDFFSGQDVCIAPVLELDELEGLPYHAERQNFTKFKTPGDHTLSAISLPFRFL